MKKNFLSVIALTIIALTCPSADGQNNIISLPPNYINFTQGPPSAPIALPIASDAFYPGSGVPNDPNDPTDGYDGQVSEYMHNAMQDVNGDLSFFVVDGMVYDKEGYLMGILSYSYGNTMPGYAEISIIPVPGNCNQYYIVSTRDNGIHTEPTLSYGLLDLTVFNSTTQKDGAFIDISTGIEILMGNQTTFPLNINQAGWHQGYVSIATTKLRSDNTRFLFAANGAEIYRFKVTANGITFDNYTFPLPFVSGDYFLRNEMEIIETLTGYRIAFAYPNINCNTCTPIIPAGITLFIGELNNIGTILSNNTAILSIIPPTSNFSPDIKGIEFSPNGNYVYITHDPTNTYPTPFKIYDVATQNFLSNASINNPQLISDITNFNNSQIELGKDGKLYLANSTSLATIDNPNNPYGGLIWNNTAQTISYNLNTLGFPQSGVGTRWIYPLPDQIDGMDYTESFFINTACCIENTVYNIETSKTNEEQYGTQTWSAGLGNNPFVSGNTVTVKDKLVIKSGANITINNMVFKFAPEAQLIVENGAKLTINGTILTVEDGCDLGKLMWHGVEVWGTYGTYQTALNPITGYKNSGIFIANKSTTSPFSNSTIEHAMVATANARHTLDGNGNPIQNSFVTGRSGGIIQANNTTFRNNYKDAQFHDYFSTYNSNTYNDQSRFTECHFVTDGLLNTPNLALFTHALLRNVKGINFIGCVFENTNSTAYPNITQRGFGIRSFQSLFIVSDKCSVIIPYPNTCPPANQTPSKFNNLFYGIFALGGAAPTQTAKIVNSEFNNNFRGMFFNNLDLAQVTNNQIVVSSDLGNTFAYGLRMEYCDKYKVEDNNFSTISGSYGAYIFYSGTGANEIYKNTFTNFKVANQAVSINGDGSALSAEKGLEFRCNEYSETDDYDILVSSGRVRSDQGNCITAIPSSPANNQFSYTAQYGDYWLNKPAVTITSTYHFSTNGTSVNLPLRSLVGGYPMNYYEIQNTSFSECTNLSYSPTISCPKRIPKTKAQLTQLISGNKQVITTLQNQIDNGNTQSLLNLIATTSGGNLKNALLASSPYLSDEVLIAYILSHPSAGNLKQVLLANSSLNEAVIKLVNEQNLPAGITNQITAAQTGTSAMQELQSEISYYQAEIDRYTYDILRIYLFDETKTEEGIKEVIAELEAQNCVCSTKENLLTCAYINNGDYTKAQQKVDTLINDTNYTNFCKLYNSVIQYEQTVAKEFELLTNSTLRTPVEEVATSSQNKEAGAATSILDFINGQTYEETFEMVGNNLRLAQPSLIVNGAANSTVVNLFPNPTSDQFTLTHNLALENGTITLTVFDLMGRKLITEQIITVETVVNTRNLKAGIYFYSVTQNKNTIHSGKLMIE